MLSKSFVSLYFLPNRFYLLQLTSNKKKVKKYSSYDLPEGLIENYRVRDHSALAQVLRGIWKKERIGEKSVGIVIPEFSTFTKVLSLPKLSIPELDEAVRWQAKEYLPSSLAKMVLDWKIVEKKADGYDVLVVAMEKEILAGYVKGAENAGLFPLSVEFPSVCLVGVSGMGEPVGKLFVYKTGGEAILVVSRGSKIFGTSVLRVGSQDRVIDTASKMVSHYGQADIKKVMIGGDEMDEPLIHGLESGLKIQPEWMSHKISGISNEALQEFLVPACMHMSDLKEPSDPYSLNLLPPELVDKYKRAKTRLQVWSITLTITLFVWISFFSALASYLFMAQNISDAKAINNANTDIAQRRQKAIAEVQEINKVANKITRIKNISVSPQKVINEITKSMPGGIKLRSYELDLDRGIIQLQGLAENRLALVEFKKNLEADENFGSVEVPISSFEVETNLNFRLAGVYLPIVPKSTSN